MNRDQIIRNPKHVRTTWQQTTSLVSEFSTPRGSHYIGTQRIQYECTRTQRDTQTRTQLHNGIHPSHRCGHVNLALVTKLGDVAEKIKIAASERHTSDVPFPLTTNPVTPISRTLTYVPIKRIQARIENALCADAHSWVGINIHIHICWEIPYLGVGFWW